MKHRCRHEFRCVLVVMITLSLALALVNAATNTLDESGLPKLSPPYPELPPTFWEQHGFLLLAVALFVLLLAVIVTVLALRPKQVVVVPPEIEARQALEELRSRVEDGAVLSRVSQVVRRYFVAVFALSPGEYTTTEFCRTLSARKEIGTDLSAGVSDFLRACDERKFSATPQSSPSSATARALELVGQAEARRAQLRQAVTAPAGATPSGKT